MTNKQLEQHFVEIAAQEAMSDNLLIKATERYVCGRQIGGWFAAMCACPDCAATNPAILGLFGSLPEEQSK